MRLLLACALAMRYAAVSAWTKHQGTNCYDGHGGVPSFTGDKPFANMTVKECGDLCNQMRSQVKYELCSAFVVESGVSVGDCYLRKYIDLLACDVQPSTGSPYDTYSVGARLPGQCKLNKTVHTVAELVAAVNDTTPDAPCRILLASHEYNLTLSSHLEGSLKIQRSLEIASVGGAVLRAVQPPCPNPSLCRLCGAVLNVACKDCAVTIKGVVITGGVACVAGGDVAGGIFNVGALTLINTTITNNNASSYSGGPAGIFNDLPGNLTLIDSSVVGNLKIVDTLAPIMSGLHAAGISSCQLPPHGHSLGLDTCSMTLTRSTVARNLLRLSVDQQPATKVFKEVDFGAFEV